MINLIIFGEEDGHKGRHQHSYATVRSSGASRNVSSASGTNMGHQWNNNPSVTVSLKDLFGDAKSNESGAPLFFWNSSNNNLSAPINFGNVTNVLKNLPETFPAFHSLRSMLPSSVSKKSNQNRTAPKGNADNTISSGGVEAILNQRYGIKLLSLSQKNENGNVDNLISFHSSSHHGKHAKNIPTKPAEVILVVSGCLFFITFFLGTFAQIKSKVSFCTMIGRFIHCNQQWIIEEYDSVGIESDNDSNESSNDKNSQSNNVESNEATITSLMKEIDSQNDSQPSFTIDLSSNQASDLATNFSTQNVNLLPNSALIIAEKPSSAFQHSIIIL